MESLRDLFVRLGLDWEGAGFAQAIATVDLLEKGLQLAVRGVQMLAHELVDSVKATTEYGSSIDDAFKKTGVARSSLQELGFAFSESGGSAEELNAALIKMAVNVQNARNGNEEAQKSFSRLGVKLTDANGKAKSSEQIFNELSSVIGGMPDDMAKTGAAVDVFGRSGANLLPLFAEGEEGVHRLREEVRDLGGVMSDEAIQAAEAFGDQLGALHVLVESLRHDVGEVLIQALGPVIHEFLEWAKANREVIRTRIQEFVKGMITGAKFLASIFLSLSRGVLFLAENFKYLVLAVLAFVAANQIMNVGLGQSLVNFALNTIAAIAYGAVMVATAIKAAIAWAAAAAPVVLIAAALVLAALAAEDFYYFLTGGDSVIGHIVNTWGQQWTTFLDNWLKPAPGEWWLTTQIKTVLSYLFDLQKLWDKIKGAMNFLAYGGDEKNHKRGAWEGPSDQQKEDAVVARGRLALGFSDKTGIPGARSDNSAQPWNDSAPWRTGGSSSSTKNSTIVSVPITQQIGPGTSPDAVGQATKEAVHSIVNDYLQDGAAATSGS